MYLKLKNLPSDRRKIFPRFPYSVKKVLDKQEAWKLPQKVSNNSSIIIKRALNESGSSISTLRARRRQLVRPTAEENRRMQSRQVSKAKRNTKPPLLLHARLLVRPHSSRSPGLMPRCCLSDRQHAATT